MRLVLLFVILSLLIACATGDPVPPPAESGVGTGAADHAHHGMAEHARHAHPEIPPPTGEIAVSLFMNDELKGAFTVTPARVVFGGPTITVWNTAPLFAPEGRTISGFRFSGWKEGGRAKIGAWALVNPAGVPAIAMDVDHHEVLLDTWIADVGDDIVVEPMRALGTEPVVLRVRDAAEAFAHEH